MEENKASHVNKKEEEDKAAAVQKTGEEDNAGGGAATQQVERRLLAKRVVIHGLMAKPELNGRTGTLTKLNLCYRAH